MPSIKAPADRNFDPLEPGKYRLVIVNATDKMSGNDNPCIRLQLQEPDSKKNVFTTLTFTSRAAWRIKNFWRALGHNVKEGDDMSFEAADIIGEEVEAEVVIREFNGDLQNEIDYYIEPEPGTVQKPAVPPLKPSKAIQPF